jgi:hypothetical protein
MMIILGSLTPKESTEIIHSVPASAPFYPKCLVNAGLLSILTIFSELHPLHCMHHVAAKQIFLKDKARHITHLL